MTDGDTFGCFMSQMPLASGGYINTLQHMGQAFMRNDQRKMSVIAQLKSPALQRWKQGRRAPWLSCRQGKADGSSVVPEENKWKRGKEHSMSSKN